VAFEWEAQDLGGIWRVAARRGVWLLGAGLRLFRRR